MRYMFIALRYKAIVVRFVHKSLKEYVLRLYIVAIKIFVVQL